MWRIIFYFFSLFILFVWGFWNNFFKFFILDLLKNLPITEYHYEDIHSVQSIDQNFFKDHFITEHQHQSESEILHSIDPSIQNIQTIENIQSIQHIENIQSIENIQIQSIENIEQNIYATVENLYPTNTEVLHHEQPSVNSYDQCQYVNVPSYTPNQDIMTDQNALQNEVNLSIAIN